MDNQKINLHLKSFVQLSIVLSTKHVRTVSRARRDLGSYKKKQAYVHRSRSIHVHYMSCPVKCRLFG